MLVHSSQPSTSLEPSNSNYLLGPDLHGRGGCKETRSVLTCVVSDLLQSAVSQNQSLGSRLATTLHVHPPPDSHTVWQEVVKVPVYHSTLVILQGQLLAVGGGDLDPLPTLAMYQYDTATNSWKIISHMNTKRQHCMAVVLSEDRLMVVGSFVEREGTTSVGHLYSWVSGN